MSAQSVEIVSTLSFQSWHSEKPTTVNCDYFRSDRIQHIYPQISVQNPAEALRDPPPRSNSWCDVYNNARPERLRPERVFEWRWRLWANFERHRGGSYDMVYLGVPNYPNKSLADGTMRLLTRAAQHGSTDGGWSAPTPPRPLSCFRQILLLRWQLSGRVGKKRDFSHQKYLFCSKPKKKQLRQKPNSKWKITSLAIPTD